MNKKLLIGFEISLEVYNFGQDKFLNFDLFQKVREFSHKYFKVKHASFVESQEMNLFCFIDSVEVPLKSRGKDKDTKSLINMAKKIYYLFFLDLGLEWILYRIKPLYYTFLDEGKFLIHEFGLLKPLDKLANTVVEMEYYGDYYNEIYKCQEYYDEKKRKRRSKSERSDN